MPVRHEQSAGVIIYRVPPREREPHFLLLDYGRFWDYAKGHVEKGEDDRTAALREVEEETGIDDLALHDDFRHEITYFFQHKKRGLIHKRVVFFLGRTKTTKVKLSDEHVGFEFLPYEQALKRVTYPTAKAALTAAHAHLEQHEI